MAVRPWRWWWKVWPDCKMCLFIWGLAVEWWVALMATKIEWTNFELNWIGFYVLTTILKVSIKWIPTIYIWFILENCSSVSIHQAFNEITTVATTHKKTMHRNFIPHLLHRFNFYNVIFFLLKIVGIFKTVFNISQNVSPSMHLSTVHQEIPIGQHSVPSVVKYLNVNVNFKCFSIDLNLHKKNKPITLNYIYKRLWARWVNPQRMNWCITNDTNIVTID